MRALFKKWKRQRRQSRKGLKFEYLSHVNIPGTRQLAAFIGDCPWPIGTVWYCFSGKDHIEILHSYVIPWARRNGVRTAIHREMQRGYPKYGFFTAEPNKRSRPWLKKVGFKKTKMGWSVETR